MKLSDLDVSPRARGGLLLGVYVLELTASLWLAYELRFDFMVEPRHQQARLLVLAWLVPLQVLLLALFHQLKPLLGYFSTPDLARLFHALTLGAVLTCVVWLLAGDGFAPPRGVIVVDFLFALVGLTGVRLALRVSRENLIASHKQRPGGARRVGLIGAGNSGAVLAHELLLKPGYGLEPVAFFDDDRRKWGSRVHDIPVLGPPERMLEPGGRADVEEVIIAMPSAPAKRVGELVRLVRQAHLKCRTVPSLDQLALGQVKVSQLREVEIQDLLGRERVELQTEGLRQVLQDRVVLVTGAGGSIGSELCRQIVTCHPARLLLLDRAEPQVFQIEQELIGLGHGPRIVPVVADILDLARMEELFASWRPQVVFHAAAHKHVPLMEQQPAEAIQNNSLGTAQLADLALRFRSDRLVLISTDKAINPTSVMGVTKRLAEIYIQALQAAHPHDTKFMAVRFGNVLGSSGSVIPRFQKQIAEGGPVSVTHPDMTRFFMTIPEACLLVLQSASQGAGGEVFVLDMGQSVRIVDLARQMIELSGLKPEVDIHIEFTGVRPGEKLYEEVTCQGENYVPTGHPKIRRFIGPPAPLEQVRRTLWNLRGQLHQAGADQLKLFLKEAVPEYTPWLTGLGPVRAAGPAVAGRISQA